MSSSIPVLDLVVAALLAIFTLVGARRGMVKELFSLFFLLLAILVWVNYQNAVLRQLAKYLGWFSWMEVAAFTVLFLASLFVSMLVDSLMLRFVHVEGKNGLFALLGAVVGLYRGVVMCAALLWILNNQPFKQGLLASVPSYLIPKITLFAPFLDHSSLALPLLQ